MAADIKQIASSGAAIFVSKCNFVGFSIFLKKCSDWIVKVDWFIMEIPIWIVVGKRRGTMCFYRELILVALLSQIGNTGGHLQRQIRNWNSRNWKCFQQPNDFLLSDSFTFLSKTERARRRVTTSAGQRHVTMRCPGQDDDILGSRPSLDKAILNKSKDSGIRILRSITSPCLNSIAFDNFKWFNF